MNYSRTEIAGACRKWGAVLWLPKEIDGPRLLWAMSGNESSFGEHCTPRHEAAYCTGVYSHSPEVVKLTERYGHGAHCSYGPWQILLVNCTAPVGPEDMVDLERASLETVKFINRRILHIEQASTVEQIAAAWNSGTFHHPNGLPEGVARYVRDFRNYYDHEAMPQS